MQPDQTNIPSPIIYGGIELKPPSQRSIIASIVLKTAISTCVIELAFIVSALVAWGFQAYQDAQDYREVFAGFWVALLGVVLVPVIFGIIITASYRFLDRVVRTPYLGSLMASSISSTLFLGGLFMTCITFFKASGFIFLAIIPFLVPIITSAMSYLGFLAKDPLRFKNVYAWAFASICIVFIVLSPVFGFIIPYVHIMHTLVAEDRTERQAISDRLPSQNIKADYILPDYKPDNYRPHNGQGVQFYTLSYAYNSEPYNITIVSRTHPYYGQIDFQRCVESGACTVLATKQSLPKVYYESQTQVYFTFPDTKTVAAINAKFFSQQVHPTHPDLDNSDQIIKILQSVH